MGRTSAKAAIGRQPLIRIKEPQHLYGVFPPAPVEVKIGSAEHSSALEQSHE
jgi:hypothetical protein